MSADILPTDTKLEYVSLAAARKMSGLRLVLGQYTIPGPWRESCKCLFDVKGIPYVSVRCSNAGAAETSFGADGSHSELIAWTAQSSAPVAIWNDERPRSSWIGQLNLAERLAPEPRLVPIEFDAQIQAYRYTHPVNSFPTVHVTEGELLALLVAQRALQQYQGTPFHRQLVIAFEKLAGGLRDRISFSPADELRAVSFKNIGLGRTDLAVFNTLSSAVLRQAEVAFEYRKPGAGKKSSRTVRPYHLANRENSWYLIGFDVERVEPTNNAAERAIRFAVLMRKGCFGSDSAKGSRFIERFLTARQTLRTQKRDLYGFLKAACAAALHGTPAPSLLPEHLRTGQRTAVAA